MRYLYVPGLSAGYTPELLAYEPELDQAKRLVLKTNGDIVVMSSADIQTSLAQGKRP